MVIEFRRGTVGFEDDDDFADILVDGKIVLELCKDTHDLETAREVIQAINKVL